MDNRPLKFDEYEGLTNQVIYVSATPGDYELEKSKGVFIEQVVRFWSLGIINIKLFMCCYFRVFDKLAC